MVLPAVGRIRPYSFGSDRNHCGPLWLVFFWKTSWKRSPSRGANLRPQLARICLIFMGICYEWCHDWYGRPDFRRRKHPCEGPNGAGGGLGPYVRGVAGPSTLPVAGRASPRGGIGPMGRNGDLGFRVAPSSVQSSKRNEPGQIVSDAGSGRREAEGVAAQRRSPD